MASSSSHSSSGGSSSIVLVAIIMPRVYVGNLPVYTNLASIDHLLVSWGLPRPLSGKIVGRRGQVVPGQEYSL